MQPEPRRSRSRKYLDSIRFGLWCKVGVTGLVVAYVVARVDLAGALRSASRLSVFATAGILVLLLAQHWVSAQRLRLTLSFLQHPMAFHGVLRSQLVGAFFNQSFLTFVAADGMRAWILNRLSVPLRVAAGAVFLDRVAGFGSLVLLVLLGLPIVVRLVPPAQAGGIVLASVVPIAALAVLACISLLPVIRTHAALEWLVQQSTQFRAFTRSWRSSSAVLLLGVMSQVINISVIYCLAISLGADLTFVDCAALIPGVILVSMLPISVGGWGVREGVMMLGLGLLGIKPELSVVISVLFGIGLGLASLPGAAVWLRTRTPVASLTEVAASPGGAESATHVG